MTNVIVHHASQPEEGGSKPAPATDVKGILKAELKRRGMTYADLVLRLADYGVIENEANLRNKISRGSFTAAFFVQCLVAIGCTVVQIKPADRIQQGPASNDPSQPVTEV